METEKSYRIQNEKIEEKESNHNFNLLFLVFFFLYLQTNTEGGVKGMLKTEKPPRPAA